MCQGWLEGYLLTGRHGFFSCYEAFIHIVDSMFNQHAKWLKVTRNIPWRRPIASLNYLLTSHVWRQDHNGFSHQDPGFIDHVVNKKADVVRVYLPPDANTLLSVADHCLRSRNYVNVIVAGKQPALQWLDMDAAIQHCTAGIGIWEWASNDQGAEPDVVMACAGDVPTLETLAAVDILRQHFPDLKIRVVNVVDLMTLQPSSEHPHGLQRPRFRFHLHTDKPIIFAFHGYPWLIHRLTYRRNNHGNLHVRGYKEEGTTTTPFDMTVLNDLDRFHLACDVIDRVPGLQRAARTSSSPARQADRAQALHRAKYGEDMPEIRELEVAILTGLEDRLHPVAAQYQDRSRDRMEREDSNENSRIKHWNRVRSKASFTKSATTTLESERERWEAQADWKQLPGQAALKIKRRGRPWQVSEVPVHSIAQTVEQLLRGLTQGERAVLRSFDEISITGHRVVHGGSRFRESTRLTEDVRNAVRTLAPFAPLHNPLALEAIEAAETVLGRGSEQAVVFDTSFHSTLPPRSYLYPGPLEWEQQGLRRYGFHGISHQYVSRRASEMIAPIVGKTASELRMITCHLGNGCRSAHSTAEYGRDNDGIHAARGAYDRHPLRTVDPGLLLYLLKEKAVTADSSITFSTRSQD